MKKMKNALALVFALVLAMGLGAMANADNEVAQIGNVKYETLQEAINAVPAVNAAGGTALPDATEIALLSNATGGYDIGNSAGTQAKNIVLNLHGYTLTLGPAVGSSGTETNGLRVLAYSKLEIKNGTVTNNDVVNAEGKRVIFPLVNYSDMALTDVTVSPYAQASLAINNRGELTLAGNTVINNPTSYNNYGGWPANTPIAITNDPYDYHYTNKNASIHVSDANVQVGNIMLELYGNTTNAGTVDLAISSGTFGTVYNDGNTAITATKNLTGGTYLSDAVKTYVPSGYQVIPEGERFRVIKDGVAMIGDQIYETLPEAVAAATTDETKITLLRDIALDTTIVIDSGKNVNIDMNGKTITNSARSADRAAFSVIHGTLSFTGTGSIKDLCNNLTLLLYGSESSTDTNYSVLNLGENVAIEMGEGVDPYAVAILNHTETTANKTTAYGVIANIEGDLKTNIGVYVSGNLTASEGNVPEINIGSGVNSGGFYLAGYAKTNVADGAVIEGDEFAIEIRAGELNINGGKFIAHAAPSSSTANGNGSTTVGAALAVAQHTTTKDIIIKIEDGTFDAYIPVLISNPENNTTENSLTLNIKGGTFNGQNGAFKCTDTRFAMNVEDGAFNGTMSASSPANVTLSGGNYSLNPRNFLGVKIAEGKTVITRDGRYYITNMTPTDAEGQSVPGKVVVEINYEEMNNVQTVDKGTVLEARTTGMLASQFGHWDVYNDAGTLIGQIYSNPYVFEANSNLTIKGVNKGESDSTPVPSEVKLTLTPSASNGQLHLKAASTITGNTITADQIVDFGIVYASNSGAGTINSLETLKAEINKDSAGRNKNIYVQSAGTKQLTDSFEIVIDAAGHEGVEIYAIAYLVYKQGDTQTITTSGFYTGSYETPN